MKRIISAIIITAMLFSGIPVSALTTKSLQERDVKVAQQDYKHEYMTAEEINVATPITTPEEFKMAMLTNGSYKLMNDITLDNTAYDALSRFGGKFNGQNKTITLNDMSNGFLKTLIEGASIERVSFVINTIAEQNNTLIGEIRGSMAGVSITNNNCLAPMFFKMENTARLYEFMYEYVGPVANKQVTVISKDTSGNPLVSKSAFVYIPKGKTEYTDSLIGTGVVDMVNSLIASGESDFTLFRDSNNVVSTLLDLNIRTNSRKMISSSDSSSAKAKVNSILILPNSNIDTFGDYIYTRIGTRNLGIFACYKYTNIKQYELSDATSDTSGEVYLALSIGEYQDQNSYPDYGKLNLNDNWIKEGSPYLLGMKDYIDKYKIGNPKLELICTKCHKDCIMTEETKNSACHTISGHKCEQHIKNGVPEVSECTLELKETCSLCTDGCTVPPEFSGGSCSTVPNHTHVSKMSCECYLSSELLKLTGKGTDLEPYQITNEQEAILMLVSKEVSNRFKLMNDVSVKIPVHSFAGGFMLDGLGNTLTLTGGNLSASGPALTNLKNVNIVINNKQTLFDEFTGSLENTNISFNNGGKFANKVNSTLMSSSTITYANGDESIFGSVMNVGSISGLKIVIKNSALTEPLLGSTSTELLGTNIVIDLQDVTSTSNYIISGASTSAIADIFIKGSAVSPVINSEETYLFKSMTNTVNVTNQAYFTNETRLVETKPSTSVLFNDLSGTMLPCEHEGVTSSIIYDIGNTKGIFKKQYTATAGKTLEFPVGVIGDSRIDSVTSDTLKMVTYNSDKGTISVLADKAGTYNFTAIVSMQSPVITTFSLVPEIVVEDDYIESITGQDNITLKAGESKSLEIITLPASATEKLIYTVSTPNIFKVEDGYRLTGLSEGTAELTLSGKNVSKVIKVVVEKNTIENLKTRIDAITEPVVYEDLGKITEVYNMYLLLSNEELSQLGVEYATKMQRVWSMINLLVEDSKAYEVFKSELFKLSDVEPMELKDGVQLTLCEALYKRLSEGSQKMVTDEQKAKLLKLRVDYNKLVEAMSILDMINQEMSALPNSNNINLGYEEALNRIQNLITTNKVDTLLLNSGLYSNFSLCMTRYAQLIGFKKEADAFFVLYSDLPSLDKLTFEHKTTVEKVLLSYTELSGESLKFLPVGIDKGLEGYKAHITKLVYENDVVVASKLIEDIKLLSEKQITDAIKDALSDLEKRYDKMSEQQKSLVTNYQTLKEIKDKFLKYKEGEYRKLAGEIISIISKLPRVEALKGSDASAVNNANSKYLELDDFAKPFVTNYSKLRDCIARIDLITSYEAEIDTFVNDVANIGSVSELVYDSGYEIRRLIKLMNSFSNDMIKLIPKTTLTKLVELNNAYRAMMNGKATIDNPYVLIEGAIGNKVKTEITCPTLKDSRSSEYIKLSEKLKKESGKELLLHIQTKIIDGSKEVLPMQNVDVKLGLETFIKSRNGVEIYKKSGSDKYEKQEFTLSIEDGVTYIKYNTEDVSDIYIVATEKQFEWVFDFFTGNKTVKKQFDINSGYKSPLVG